MQLSEHFNATTVSLGDLLTKEVVKRTSVGQDIEYYLKNHLYVPDHITVEVLTKHLNALEDNSQCFVEGFPKTIYQAKYLVNQGILPDAIIFINSNEEDDRKTLEAKFEANNPDNDSEIDHIKNAKNYSELYSFNINQCKTVFRDISLEFDNREYNAVEKLARLVRYRLKKGFDSPLKFVILGKSTINKNLVTQKFYECFGVKPISPDQLVQSEISTKSELSHKLLFFLEKNQPVPNDLIFELMTRRVDMTDAQVNGYSIDLTGLDIELIQQVFNKKLGLNFTIMIEDEDLSPEYYRQLVGLTEGSYRYIVSDDTSEVSNLINKIVFEITHIKDK